MVLGSVSHGIVGNLDRDVDSLARRERAARLQLLVQILPQPKFLKCSGSETGSCLRLIDS